MLDDIDIFFEDQIALQTILSKSFRHWKQNKKTEKFQTKVFPTEKPITTRQQSYLKRQIIKVILKQNPSIKLEVKEKGNYSLRNFLIKIKQYEMLQKIFGQLENIQEFIEKTLSLISKKHFKILTPMHKFLSCCFIIEIKEKIQHYILQPRQLIHQMEKRKKKTKSNKDQHLQTDEPSNFSSENTHYKQIQVVDPVFYETYHAEEEASYNIVDQIYDQSQDNIQENN